MKSLFLKNIIWHLSKLFRTLFFIKLHARYYAGEFLCRNLVQNQSS